MTILQMLPPFNLPEGIVLLITDQLASPADFLLHKSLAAHIKTAPQSKHIIFSVSEGISRWKAIASKSNVNLAQHIDSDLLRFIDVLSHVPLPPDDAQRPALRPLLAILSDALKESPEGALVILDDLTVLAWIGFNATDVTRFIRAARALCLQSKATLIVRHHVLALGEPDDLFHHLLQICTYHLEVLPLASGRSGSVSGEIALHTGPCTLPGDIKTMPRSSALQYRLTDAGAVFFERGTSGIVL